MPGMGCQQSVSGPKAINKLLTKTGRRKQPSHVYLALFYTTDVKPLMDYSAYKASLAPEVVPMSRFAYRNFCTRKAWEKAPPEIRQEVMDQKKLLDMSLEELEMLDDEDPQGESVDTSNMDNTPVLEGLESSEGSTTLGSENLSADKEVSVKISQAKPGDNPESSEGPLTLKDEAASKFQLALKETLRIKKVEAREQ